MNKTIFVNVDTQKDFMNPNGKLYIKNAELLKPNLAILTEFARINNHTIVSTADWHTTTDAEISTTPDFITTFPEHCIAHSEGAEFIPETNRPYDLVFPCDPKIWLEQHGKLAYTLNYNSITIYKNTFNVFQSNKFTERIFELLHPDHVVIYGVASEFCVHATILELMKRKIPVTVVLDAIKAVNPDNLKDQKIMPMWAKLGVKFTTTTNVLTMETYQNPIQIP